MVKVPTESPITGEKVAPNYLHSSDLFFRDTSGRAVLLRGVNLSGSSKAPIGQPSQKLEGFWEKAENGGESFIGQPLNLQDGSADLHLTRLKTWGFNSFRYIFTWEALEHQGPGKFDHEFMDYTVAVLCKIKEYGFKVFMDPHQDLFSRFTGGSGAPYWVLPACGMNPRNFTATQAAFLHCEWPSAENPSPIDFPDMLWATNYTRLAAATLSVLFFAGRDFAPKCIIDGKNIQDYLQDHYFNAIAELAKKIRDSKDKLFEDCVIGWDSFNEPNQTYLSLEDLNVIPNHWQLKKGPMPTPIEQFRLGTGMKQTITNWVFGGTGPKKSGVVVVDPKGKSIWMDAEMDSRIGGSKWGWERSSDWPLGQCVWAGHGVWSQDNGQLLRPDYFKKFGGPNNGTKPLDFAEDYWLPHWRGYEATLRPIHKDGIMFLLPPVFEPPPRGLTDRDLKNRACLSSHFYDGLTLITKHWNWYNADAVGVLRGKYPGVMWAIRVGAKAVRKCMRDQLGYLAADAKDSMGKYPTMIGELGIPYDLDNKKTYFGDGKGGNKGMGDYSSQTLAMDASLNACDGPNLLSYSLWTYCSDNTHTWGDGWNGEDLSIWSLDDVKGGGSGKDLLGSRSPSPASLQESRDPSLSGSGSDSSTGTSTPTKRTNEAQIRPSSSSSSSSSASSSRLPPALVMTSDGKDSAASPLTLEPAELASSSVSVNSNASERLNPGPLFSTSNNSNSSLKEPTVPLLTNGSRSATAFCRPYPVATVGTPVNIDFDIKSSEFIYSFEVDQTDTSQEEDEEVRTYRAMLGEPEYGMDDGLMKVPIKIYLPFIHYAKDALLGAASGNQFDCGKQAPSTYKAKKNVNSVKRRGSSASMASNNSDAVDGMSKLRLTSSGFLPPRGPFYDGGEERNSSTSSLGFGTTKKSTKNKLALKHKIGEVVLKTKGSKSSLKSSRSRKTSGDLLAVPVDGRSRSDSTFSNISTGGAPHNPTASMLAELDLELDLNVELSAGDYVVRGQYLYWYLPKTASPDPEPTSNSTSTPKQSQFAAATSAVDSEISKDLSSEEVQINHQAPDPPTLTPDEKGNEPPVIPVTTAVIPTQAVRNQDGSAKTSVLTRTRHTIRVKRASGPMEHEKSASAWDLLMSLGMI